MHGQRTRKTEKIIVKTPEMEHFHGDILGIPDHRPRLT